MTQSKSNVSDSPHSCSVFLLNSVALSFDMTLFFCIPSISKSSKGSSKIASLDFEIKMIDPERCHRKKKSGVGLLGNNEEDRRKKAWGTIRGLFV